MKTDVAVTHDMTEVAPADHLSLLQLKRAECSSIVTSRKRKLRELFAVATEPAAIPDHDFQHVDAPLPTPVESHFLIESSVLQTPDDLKPPPRQQNHVDALQRFLAISAKSLGPTSDVSTAKNGAENGLLSNTPSGPAGIGSKGLPKGHRAVGQSSENIPLASKSTVSPQKSLATSGGAVGDVARGEVGRRDASRVATPSPTAAIAPDQNRHADLSHSFTATDVAANRSIKNGKDVSASTHELPKPDSPVNGKGVSTGQSVPTVVSTPLRDDGQDAMDVDVPDQVSNRRTDRDLPSIQLPAGDVSKVTDLLSSPGSTAHSATTPAIHDTSTDTSPDNEGQYGGREDDNVEQEKDADNISSETGAAATDIAARNLIQPPEDSQGPANQAIEAQLLQESAAARDSQSDQRSPQLSARATEVEAEDGAPDGEVAATLPAVPEESSDSPSMANPPKIEIRDSQESSPVEAMDIDPQPSDRSRTVDEPEKRLPQGSLEASSVVAGKAKQNPLALEDGQHQTDLVHPLPTPGEQRSERLLQHISVTTEQNRGVSKKRVPTVLFGKQRKRKTDKLATSASRAQSSSLLSEDYFTPLFVQSFSGQTKWMKQIDVLIGHAHKAISTTDLQTAILENQACKVLKRVYHLQQHDKWSLRQPKRCPEPTRPPSHWDVLLQEIKWMRTDFREERKWKTTVARNLALACAEWVTSTPEQKKALQVNVAVIRHLDNHDEATVVNGITDGEEGDDVTPTPELIASGDTNSPAVDDEDLGNDYLDTVAPSAIFALPDDDVIFSMRKSPTSDQLLEELPMYGAPLKVPKFDLTGPEYDPDFLWRRPAVPLSKYIEGQVVLSSPGSPSVRGRYQYKEEDGEDDDEQVLFGKQPSGSTPLPRENKEVALFNPEMRPIRDRLHAGHQFRPPTEHPMPLQSFFESRPNSQWTTAEDDKLKALVREHSYNWSLISGLLSTKSLFSSGAERRTPWECFERWIALEGLPNDMSKTQYFKTYQNRIDAATRAIQEQQQKAQQQAGANGSLTPVQRRRPTHPIKVERRRTQKHLALIDAMRKLAKKRETAIQKQQYAASLAASRKANEPQQQQRGPTKTPREYSLMRYERDAQLAEKMAQYAQRQTEVQRRQQVMARSQGQAPQAATGSNPVPPQVAAQLSANPLAGTPRANVPSQLAVPGQARPRMPIQAPPNGMASVQAHMGGGLVAPIPMNGIPQAQMQAMQAQAQQRMQQQMPNPQPDMALVLQARRIQDQQRAAVQLQQQQAHQQQGPQPQQLPQGHPGAQVSPTGMRTAVNGMNQQNFLANSQAMMAASFNAAGGTGMGTPPAGVLNMAAVAAGSPRATAAQQLSPAMMNHIRELEASFKAKNPNLSDQQARALAYSNYQNIMMRQNAIASASGGSPQQGLVNGIASNSPHQYAQLLRAQQQAQQAQSAQHQRQPSSGAVSK